MSSDLVDFRDNFYRASSALLCAFLHLSASLSIFFQFGEIGFMNTLKRFIGHKSRSNIEWTFSKIGIGIIGLINSTTILELGVWISGIEISLVDWLEHDKSFESISGE